MSDLESGRRDTFNDHASAHGYCCGVGSEQGLGAALVRRFAVEGHRVIVAGRTEFRISQVARAIVDSGGKAEAFRADTTIESDVVALFDFAGAAGHIVDLVVFNAGNNVRPDFRTMPAELFEQTWRIATFGGFLAGYEAARRRRQVKAPSFLQAPRRACAASPRLPHSRLLRRAFARWRNPSRASSGCWEFTSLTSSLTAVLMAKG